MSVIYMLISLLFLYIVSGIIILVIAYVISKITKEPMFRSKN